MSTQIKWGKLAFKADGAVTHGIDDFAASLEKKSDSSKSKKALSEAETVSFKITSCMMLSSSSIASGSSSISSYNDWNSLSSVFEISNCVSFLFSMAFQVSSLSTDAFKMSYNQTIQILRNVLKLRFPTLPIIIHLQWPCGNRKGDFKPSISRSKAYPFIGSYLLPHANLTCATA